jgi:hypothetical protein
VEGKEGEVAQVVSGGGGGGGGGGEAVGKFLLDEKRGRRTLTPAAQVVCSCWRRRRIYVSSRSGGSDKNVFEILVSLYSSLTALSHCSNNYLPKKFNNPSLTRLD